MKEGLLTDRKPVLYMIEMETNHQEVKMNKEIILTIINEEAVKRLLSSCKEILFLLMLLFRDTTSLGSGIGSPLVGVVRVEGQEG